MLSAFYIFREYLLARRNLPLFGDDMIDQIKVHHVVGKRDLHVGQVVFELFLVRSVYFLLGEALVGEFEGIYQQVYRNTAEMAKTGNICRAYRRDHLSIRCNGGRTQKQLAGGLQKVA